MERSRLRTRTIIIAAVILIITALIVGLFVGSYITVKSIARIAAGFLKIDYKLVEQAIFQYENQIGNCFPAGNLTI